MSTKICEDFSKISIISDNKILVPGTIFKSCNDMIYQFIGYNMHDEILYQPYNNTITSTLYHGKQSDISQLLYEPSYYKAKTLF